MNGFTRRIPFLFEFNDHASTPVSLKTTLHEILEAVCDDEAVQYYDGVAQSIAAELRSGKFRRVIELGAGNAPLSKRLAPLFPAYTFVACDLFPQKDVFRSVANLLPNFEPRLDPVDYLTMKQVEGQETLYILSSTFHHVRFERRYRLLSHITGRGAALIIAEPLQLNLVSFLATTLSLLRGLSLPLRVAPWRARGRRVVWCWLLPVAPLLIWWDGLVSCLRQAHGEIIESFCRETGLTLRAHNISATASVKVLGTHYLFSD